MPVRIVGMIGVTPPRSDAALHVIEGGLSPSYLTQFARAHDDAGFDLALVGCTSSSAEGFLVALHAAAHAKQLGYLVAHRPGFVAPTLMARKIATFDHLTNGRLAVHIITGKTDDEQQGDGDFSPKTERYRRAAEYLELMKLAWSSERPFDFSGEFYRVKGASSDVRPQQEPHPLLFFGAASDGAFAMGARLCDVYAIYAEPLASNASPASGPKQRPSGGRRASTFRCARSLRRSEGDAWEKANRILAAMTGKKGWSRQEEATGPVDNAGKRLMRFAMEQDIHDERLWMPIARSANYRRAAAAVDIGLAVARRAEALRLHRGIGREPTVGGHEAMAAFHARAEGTLPNRCSPPLFDDDEGVWNERVPQGEQRSRRFPLSDRCNGRNEIGEVINTAQTPTSRASRVG